MTSEHPSLRRSSHLLLSLFSFNIRIEMGQLAVLAIMLPGLVLFRRLVAERTGIIILSAVVAVIGGYWIVECWQVLNQMQWPRLMPMRSSAMLDGQPWR